MFDTDQTSIKIGLWGHYMMEKKRFLKKNAKTHIPSATLTDTTGQTSTNTIGMGFILYLVTDESLWLCVFGPIPDCFRISFFLFYES